jgi:hypothetical protein
MSSNFTSLRMTSGGTVPAAKWNALLALLQESQLSSVVNAQLKRSAAGSVLVIPPRTKSAPGDSSHPFKIVDASTTEPDTAKIQVTYGAVNNIVPSSVDTPITITGDVKVFLDCTVGETDGVVTAVAVDTDTTVPADTSTHAYILLGEADVASSQVSEIRQSVRNSLQHQRCPADDTGVNLFWAV